MKKKLTDKDVEEIIQARYEAENPHILTKEEKNRANQNQKKLKEYMNNMQKHN